MVLSRSVDISWTWNMIISGVSTTDLSDQESTNQSWECDDDNQSEISNASPHSLCQWVETEDRDIISPELCYCVCEDSLTVTQATRESEKNWSHTVHISWEKKFSFVEIELFPCVGSWQIEIAFQRQSVLTIRPERGLQHWCRDELSCSRSWTWLPPRLCCQDCSHTSSNKSTSTTTTTTTWGEILQLKWGWGKTIGQEDLGDLKCGFRGFPQPVVICIAVSVIN